MTLVPRTAPSKATSYSRSVRPRFNKKRGKTQRDLMQERFMIGLIRKNKQMLIDALEEATDGEANLEPFILAALQEEFNEEALKQAISDTEG